MNHEEIILSKKNYTSEDVAQLAGVSQSTVSRVFANSTNVSEKKRKKVLEAAERLGYHPNAIARSLSTRKTKLIGIVIRNFQNPFYTAALSQFYRHLAVKGYHLILINAEKELVQEKEIDQLLHYNVEGVIITDALLSSTEVERFSRYNISVILFNRYVGNLKNSAVFTDNYLAGRQIATYLVGMGHQSFAFISGESNSSTNIDRKRGFEEVLKERGIEKWIVQNGEYSYESGFKLAQELMSRREKIDCIFCANDIIAVGAMEGIRKMGLRIPKDISIAGCDNIYIAGWPSFSLTTWGYSSEEMVGETVKLLVDEIEGKSHGPKTVVVKGNLIIRDSVARKQS
jgi:DNA-binding LacI/PurR family transcriptional regulator